MQTVKMISEVRDLIGKVRLEGKTVSLVPTMGALHVGHISLIKAAKSQSDFVVVSIFVNPTQFGPNEDFKRYPRPVEKDQNICKDCGVDVVFKPSEEQMYPEPNLSWVNVEGISKSLCGKSRPRHFRGVATVCAKLFNIVTPDMAFFGQKDAQQAAIIKTVVRDLNIPAEIRICPTVREPSGLAVSSRNRYLSQQQKKDAAGIYRSLQSAEKLFQSGTFDTGPLKEKIKDSLSGTSSIDIEYISVVDPETFSDIDHIEDRGLIAIAVQIGSTRLIDNIILE